ncbi:MAG: outer membrane protein assembly factor BamC [Cellvibrionaceae bacterium]|nr:outer membrane protein assembly factor BamC [Cellvibrionaceae bacterium]
MPVSYPVSIDKHALFGPDGLCSKRIAGCLLMVFTLALTACASRSPAYLSAQSQPALVLPASVDGQRLGQLYAIAEARAPLSDDPGVPPPPLMAIQQQTAAAVQRFNGRLWLTHARSPAGSWSQLVAFWRDLGVPLARRDLTAVVLETQWFSEALQPGFEVRYQLRLTRGLQPDNTEIYIANQKRQVGVQAPDSEHPWSHSIEDGHHSQWLIERLLDYFNNPVNKPADSLLATRIQLPRKVFLDDSDGEPVLTLAIAGERSVQSLTEALMRPPFLTYDRAPEAGIFYIHNRQNKGEKTTWLGRLNPFSAPRHTAFVETSPYALDKILQHLAWDKPRVQALFESSDNTPARPLSDAPGYLMVLRAQTATASQLFVRDARGLPLADTEARKLLSLVWRQLL